MYMNIALRRFLNNHGNIATEGSRDHALLLLRMTSRVLANIFFLLFLDIADGVGLLYFLLLNLMALLNYID